MIVNAHLVSKLSLRRWSTIPGGGEEVIHLGAAADPGSVIRDGHHILQRDKPDPSCPKRKMKLDLYSSPMYERKIEHVLHKLTQPPIVLSGEIKQCRRDSSNQMRVLGAYAVQEKLISSLPVVAKEFLEVIKA